MKKIQIEATSGYNNEILRAAGVKRVRDGWYTVTYNGVTLDSSTAVSAKRNPRGNIQFANPAR